MISTKDLTAKERKSLRKSERTVSLRTANGIVSVDTIADISIESLGIVVTCFILANVPPVLSMGSLTLDNGFDFTWCGKAKWPYLRQVGTGKIIPCVPSHNVPFLLQDLSKPGSLQKQAEGMDTMIEQIQSQIVTASTELPPQGHQVDQSQALRAKVLPPKPPAQDPPLRPEESVTKNGGPNNRQDISDIPARDASSSAPEGVAPPAESSETSEADSSCPPPVDSKQKRRSRRERQRKSTIKAKFKPNACKPT